MVVVPCFCGGGNIRTGSRDFTRGFCGVANLPIHRVEVVFFEYPFAVVVVLKARRVDHYTNPADFLNF